MSRDNDLAAFDPNETLSSLHGFQRDSAEYAFSRLYKAQDSTRRFLIADEVGLGKTLIAKGVIAKTIAHLRDSHKRIDVVYICSNLRIAQQNINRLNPLRNQEFTNPGRITLLPLVAKEMSESRVNLVAFTPGTSLDLKQSLGTAEERCLLFALLSKHWEFSGVSALNVLQGNVQNSEWFRAHAKEVLAMSLDAKALTRRFYGLLDGRPELRQEFASLCNLLPRRRDSIPAEIRPRRNAIVGRLRWFLAQACIDELEPDLIILDEFQRFKTLLDRESEDGELAQQLFDWSKGHEAARVLLLSATPYKAYTLQHELAEDDHYDDFLRTVDFLNNDSSKTSELKLLLANYRRDLPEIGKPGEKALFQTKDAIEIYLRRVMSRTERLAAGAANGMLRASRAENLTVDSHDMTAYAALRKLADELEVDDALEYWKSAAYPLNFMEGYQLREALSERETSCDDDLVAAAVMARSTSLPFESMTKYQPIPIPNARMRDLFKALDEERAFDTLWLRPSLSYYTSNDRNDPIGVVARKRLIFSAWHVVPRSIAALLSYEAERRAITGDEAEPLNTLEARQNRRGLLRFAIADGRAVGMPVLTLVYPCRALARLCDPRVFAAQHSQGVPDRSGVVAWAEIRIKAALPPTIAIAREGEASDEQWYWAAPLVLDSAAGESSLDWGSGFDSDPDASNDLAADATDTDADSAWTKHLDLARAIAGGESIPTGKAPADLCHVLALVAIGAPATAALRGFERLYPVRSTEADLAISASAARIGWSFRSLFNRPESMALLRRGHRDTPYWRLVLEYSVDGCLSAVLDEYLHVLRDSGGLTADEPTRACPRIAEAASEALQIRSARLVAEDLQVIQSSRSIKVEKVSMRSLFAMRFGTDATEDEKQVRRDTAVSAAFNSPFWPFVLVTTSVGQEGLDFHWYCHSIVHWNLPSNPVDLEQREGRVHRFKGHAVRKNVASVHGLSALRSGATDIWNEVFRLASTEQKGGDRGLTPYWLYALADGAWIERSIPVYPFSRDSARFVALQRSLAAYRMVFGQPRQEELLAFLLNRFDEETIARTAALLRIDLAPPLGVTPPAHATASPA